MAKIYLNEDSSHYFFTRREKASDMAEIMDFIQQYKGTNVERFILNANAQRTSFRSRVWESIEDHMDMAGPYLRESPGIKDWMSAVKDLADRNIDVYALWIDALRGISISPWISMRMNDVHNANDIQNPLHSSFYRNHLEYRRAMYRDQGWEDRQLNYLVEEVRKHHMRLVEEYFQRYDFDGLELDWMRFGNHFPTGRCDEGRPVLDAFMKRIRELADKHGEAKGRRIGIGVRVPVDPSTAFDMGMDASLWAREGYVDYIAPSPFWETSQHDIPVEMWKKLVHGTGVKIAPCLEICLRQTRFPHCQNEHPFNRMETIRAAAFSYVDRGADAVYFFNYMDRLDDFYTVDEYRDILEETGSRERMLVKPKRFILTFNDRKPDGKPWDVRLPDSLKKDIFHEYRLHTGNLKGCHARMHVVLSFSGVMPAQGPEVFLNGERCRPEGKVELSHPRPAHPCFRWSIPEEGFKNGYQVVEVVPHADDLVLEWVEISLE
ncbi:MAG: hypothetical protein R6W96_07480 [Clostridia bacterium]